jgi:hypothetical protein
VALSLASFFFFFFGRLSYAVSVLKLASVRIFSTTIPSLATNTTFANCRCCLPSRSPTFSSLYDQVLTHGPLGKLKVSDIYAGGGYCSFMIECAYICSFSHSSNEDKIAELRDEPATVGFNVHITFMPDAFWTKCFVHTFQNGLQKIVECFSRATTFAGGAWLLYCRENKYFNRIAVSILSPT